MISKTNFLQLFLIVISIQASAQKFAVIGDYGDNNGHELAVSNLVKSWNPDFIVTVGDNNYDFGEASTIDINIGQYYHDFIKPYTGTYGAGSPDVNRFFPVPGNHDWDSPDSNLTPYTDYFTLPNNERYYDFVWGDVHFFMIDSDIREPDGITETSTQANWIQNKMINSTAKWKIVILHHPPYSSTGSTTTLRWPFKSWGADAVFAGHKHNYERLLVDGLVYFVNGLGGKSKQSFRTILPESIIRYNNDYGAMLVDATSNSITFSFKNTSGTLIDSYSISDPFPVELTNFLVKLNGDNIELNWRTETEINNYGFVIERTINTMDWIKIGFVEGNGNSNSPKYYEYIDSDITIEGNYSYRLKQIDNDGTYEYSAPVNITIERIDKYYLSQNYPNPFNPITRIDFTIPEEQLVVLTVYNVLGEFVTKLVDETKEPGSYSVKFDASNLPSGTYIYILSAGEYISSGKMSLMK